MIQKLQEAIILTASYYGKALSEPVLAMYVEDLADLPTPDVIAAYGVWRRNPKNTQFPLPAQIRGIVRPEVDTDSAAREIAARIQEAIVHFGSWQDEEAKQFIGDVGWSIVRTYGGWSRLCEEHGVVLDKGQFTAQARDLAKGRLTYAPVELALAIGARNEIQGLESAKAILKLITAPEEKP